jgi:hypothetical protein
VGYKVVDLHFDILGCGVVSPNMLGFPKFVCDIALEVAGCCEHSGVVWWAHQDSNLGPSDYESDALTN